MTPAEQIAYLRKWLPACPLLTQGAIAAVCDLAERALLTDDEAEAIHAWLTDIEILEDEAKVNAVLRRLLPDERVEHRLQVAKGPSPVIDAMVKCSCGTEFWADTLHDAIVLGAAHAGIGGTE